MNTKKVCDKLHVTPKMLRVYEDAGLLSPERKENSYRDYSSEDILKIEVIARLRNLGFSIKNIKEMMAVETVEDKYINLFYIQFKALESKINEMTETKAHIKQDINDILQTKYDSVVELIHNDPGESSNDNMLDTFVEKWNFDNMAADYENKFLAEDKGYTAGTEMCIKYIQMEPVGTRIMDVGCGTCDLWENFSEHKYDITAMDNSLNMILAARKKLPYIRYYLADILNIDDIRSQTNKYDVVTAVFTLHHIIDTQQQIAVKNIIDMCRPNGKVIIVDKYFRNKADKEQRIKELQKDNDNNALKILNSEWSLYSDEFMDYLKFLNCDVRFQKIMDNIGCFTIRRLG